MTWEEICPEKFYVLHGRLYRCAAILHWGFDPNAEAPSWHWSVHQGDRFIAGDQAPSLLATQAAAVARATELAARAG